MYQVRSEVLTGKSEFKPWEIKNIEQIWAEVLIIYNNGESLILASSLTEASETAQIEELANKPFSFCKNKWI